MIKKRAMNPNGTQVERRKSSRFSVAIPLEVSWQGTDNPVLKADAIALQVNASGGFLKMSVCPEPGRRVTLANFLSAQTADARVLAAPHTREGLTNGVIVELIVPSESFWGVNLQMEKTSVALRQLEEAMKREGIDLRMLKEYREAVDYIRFAAGTVQQLRKCQLRGSDDGAVHSALAAERIRRTANSCLEVLTDLGAGCVNNEWTEVIGLYETVAQLCNRLKRGCQGNGNRNGPANKAREPKLILTAASRNS